MKQALSLLCWLTISGCATKEKHPKQHAVIPGHSSALITNYDSCKAAILQIKQIQKQHWPGLSNRAKEKIFTSAVTETIMPAWMGTAWNFYGTTETPRQGSIACGYFVTTILRDAGLPIGRIRLAQCASEEMIRSLVQARYVSRFSNYSLEDFTRAIQQQGYGLYLIGLDNHTGFIYHDGNEIYFIHASYQGARTVIKERAAASGILRLSKYKVTGKISSDEQALNRWILTR